MENTVKFTSQTLESMVFLKDILNAPMPLFLMCAGVFIASSYRYFDGKHEEDNRFDDYKTAAEVAAYAMIFLTAWQFYSNHSSNGVIFIILGYFTFHLHIVCEDLWKDDEIIFNSIPKEVSILNIYPDRSSWNKTNKRYETAKMNVRYKHDLEIYSNLLDIPIDIFLRYQIGEQIEIKMSKNHPEVIAFEIDRKSVV